MADRVQHRRDTAARWAKVNPVLLEGEIGYVLDNPNQHKIGDGEHAWNDLPLRGFTGNIAQSFGDDENAVVSQKVVTEEKRRAENAEKKNSDAIAAEVTRAQEAEGVNAAAIVAEVERAEAAESALQDDIDGNTERITDEVKRAQEAELTLVQAISGVVGRVTAIEGGYATDAELLEESERAQGAENSLAEDIGVISGDLEKEIQRAKEAEQALSTEITEAENRVDERVTEVRDNLEAEVQARSEAVADLNANTGISEYPAFDPAEDYAVGDVVVYDGLLKRFTAEHVAGEWNGTDVEAWSERKEVNKIYLEFVKGKFIDSLGGFSTAANDSYGGTQKYYRVKGGATYRTNCYPIINYYLAFYDENKNFISAILTDERKDWSFIAPENAAYARFSHQSSLEHWVAIYYESYDLLTQVREDIEANKDNMDEAKPLILDGYAGRVLSFLRQEKNGKAEIVGDIIVNRTFSEESTKSNIEWRAYDSTTDTLTYAFATVGWDSKIYLNTNTVIIQTIKNTSNNTIDISVGIGLSRDWSSPIKYYRISIAAGETKNVVFTENDWKESSYYSENCAAYCTIALFGRDDLPRPSVGGSLEWMISYKETYVLVDKANEAYKSEDSNHANEADWAKESSLARKVYTTGNAGWEIGGFAKDAVFRDAPHPNYADGYVEGAMTVEVVDERTVRLTTNIAADEVGSAYRGVYWKIYFNSLSDIKGLWTLYNTYSGYNVVRILSAIRDWGPSEKDVIVLSSAGLGSKKTWDFYDAIVAYKEQQEALGDESKWTGLIEEQGYFYLVLVRYSLYGKLPIIEDTLQLDHEPISKRVIATELSDELTESIKEELGYKEDIKQVTCWGDSLTAGAGSDKHYNQETVLDSIKAKGFSIELSGTDSITYAKMLQELLGGEYNVTNCGVGGESINTIAARMGANMGKLPFEVVIPADKSNVLIGNNVTEGEKLVGTWSASAIQPLLQGLGNSVNPCYIEGIECTLTASKDSYSGTWDRNYYVARTAEGDRDITIPAGTPIIMGGSKLYRNTEIAILWCWQNGGFSDLDDLINKLKKMIAHIGNKKYIIVGLHSGNATNRKEQEDALVAEFGDKFFNWRRYVSSNALYDFGITPTTDSNFTEEQLSSGVKSDMTAMSEGSLPSSLWRIYVGDESGATTNDSIHLNAAGYAILGYKLYERMKVLGYV